MTGNAKKLKRRNHEVPRGLLKNWLGSKGGQQGYHFWDFADCERKFEKGSWAGFAVTELLYVPFVSEIERSDALEDWFAVDENGLALLGVAAQSGQVHSLKPKILTQAIRAAIALGFRNAYQFYCIGEVLDAQKPGQHLHGNIIDNAYKVFQAKFRQFSNWDFTIVYALPLNLLINESPFFDWTLRPDPQNLVTMPLAPNAILFGTPPPQKSRKEMAIRWTRGEDKTKLAELQNQFSVENARQWIVSKTPVQIDDLAKELSRERLEHRRSLDRTVMIKVSGNEQDD